MAKLKDGKTENLTIRVEADLKARAESIRQKYFKRVPMNIFLEMMIEKGLEFEEFLREREKDALEEFVGRMPVYEEKRTGTGER
ncbi:hypothetical protein Holit_01594 [Hollandina sp. SP2]